MKRQMKSTKLIQKYGLEKKVEKVYLQLCVKRYRGNSYPFDVELEFEAKKLVLHNALVYKKQKMSELSKEKSNQICDAYQNISTKDLNLPLIEEICQECIHYTHHVERLSKEIIELENYANIIKHDYEILMFNSGLH
jgi:hypothetical protein